MGEEMNGNAEEKFERLPTIAKPTHYKIQLKPDLETFTFEGEAAIDLQITRATEQLKLHAVDLEITSARVRIGRDVRDNLPVNYQKKWETVTIGLNHEITPGPVQLLLKFKGILNDKMHGFYRSKYTGHDGVERYLAVTQFESTYARYAYPCWDEPIYRAKFDMTLIVPENKVALSNMNEISTEKTGDGWKKITYATTPSMSTYITAFAVGDFDYVEDNTKSGVKVRIYTPPTKSDQGKFALEVARKALEFYDEFFHIPYPLPKCDLIAVPDFAMGAMENWGLVTYRDVYLLVDPLKSSARAKAHIALVVGHELAHMWFGNLVTMKWWTDLWLKEGFATFMEYAFVAHAYPEFHIWLQFANDEVARGMSLDALKSSHPIEVPIDNPNELEEIYDAVSYSKSASVIRMLYSYLGQEKFQAGLKLYLSSFQYNNAVTQDLWTSLAHASGEDVATLMGVWTQKMGFPLVSVASRQDGGNRILTLTQKRFLADGTDDHEAPIWQIPININTSSSGEHVKEKFLLKEKTAELVLHGVTAEEWVKLNSGLAGYYRVEYSDDMLNALLPAVRDRVLSPVDRFNLVTDIFALVKAGRVPATQFLSLLEACAEEDVYNVWAEMDVGVSSLGNVFGNDPDLEKRLDAFVRKVYGPIGKKMGWDPKPDEGYQAALLRSLALGRLGWAGEESVLNVARQKFKEHAEGGKELVPDQRGMIYGLIGRYDGEHGFEALRKIFETSDFSEVQRHCIGAFANSDDVHVQKKALQYSMGDKVRSGELYLPFSSATSTYSGKQTAWEFFQHNYDAIVQKYGGANSAIFQAIVKLSSRSHASEDKAKEVEKFFAGKKKEEVAVLDRTIRQSVENIRLNAALLTRNQEPVKKWLVAKGY